ncbi:hypothetical protein [Agrobacterium sp.]|uniref:hypothetical protein n=1 Tax=Agrobacterium sp. TaxID=361 RepID=UPI0028A5FB5F|nr:hypothetical protein [Agrobacterium sp.]
MEEFARELLELSMFMRILWSWPVMVFSAWAILAMTKPTWKIGGGAYFFGCCVVFVVLYASTLLYLPEPLAIEHGYAHLIVGTHIALMMVAGAVAGLFAAARSRDAYGENDRWLMGLVPVTNLALVFDKSHEKTKPIDDTILTNIFLMLAGLGVLISATQLERIAEKRLENFKFSLAQQASQPPPPPPEPRTQSEAIQAALKRYAASRIIPQNFDKNVRLTTVVADGYTLIYRYRITHDNEAEQQQWQDLTEFTWCNANDYKELFAFGATLQGELLDRTGNIVRSANADAVGCSLDNLKIDAEMTERAKAEKTFATTNGALGVSGASYANRVYTITIFSPDPVPALAKDVMRKNWCNRKDYKSMLLKGVTIRGAFETKSGRPLETLDVNVIECGIAGDI